MPTAVGFGEEVIAAIIVLGLLEKAVVDKRLVRHPCRLTAVEKFNGERAVQARALDVPLDEENFRDGVESAAGVYFVDIAQDAVTLEKKVLKLFTVECAKPVSDFFNALHVTPIGCLGNFVDLDELTRRAGDQLEDGRIAVVMGYEELATRGAGVAFALVKVLDVDIDVLGLALDHECGRFVRDFGSGCLPNNNIGARASVPVHGSPLLVHLRQFVAVVVPEMTDEALADDLFQFGRDVPLLVA